MKDKNHYTELMNETKLNRKNAKDTDVLQLYIDMLLTEILLKSKLKELSKKIDDALDQKDKETFLTLSIEYKKISKQLDG